MTQREKELTEALRHALIQWAHYAEFHTGSTLATDATPEAIKWRLLNAMLLTPERKAK